MTKGFNYTAAKQLGYSGQGKFFRGNVQGRPNEISWHGSGEQNLTWSDISNQIFLKYPDYQDSFGESIDLAPFGKCYEARNYSLIKPHFFEIKFKGLVYFSDPDRQSSYRSIILQQISLLKYQSVSE